MIIYHNIMVVLIGILPKFIRGQTDPTNIACTAFNATTLQLIWTQASDTSVLGYYLDCERVDGLKIEPAIPTVDLNSRYYDNYDFHGLGKYGTYNITIKSYTASTTLTPYVTTCITSEDVPDSAPLSFTCQGTTMFSITCTWDAMSQVYWNGAQLGYRLQWLSSNISQIFSTTVSANVTSATATRLDMDTTYFLLLNAYTSVGHGAFYSTNSVKTKAFTTTAVENVTKYYCYEALPGYIEFGWEEMPCTIYTGTIAALLVVCGIFVAILACQACCGKGSSSTDMSVNIFNASSRKPRRPGNYSDSDSDDEHHDDDDDDKEQILEDEEENNYDEIEEHDNEGYRSTEEHSDDDRDTPYEDGRSTNNSKDRATSRKRGVTPKVSKGAKHRPQAVGGAELQPIDEIENLSDSDYDTQSDYEENEENEYNSAKSDSTSLKQAAVGKVITTKTHTGNVTEGLKIKARTDKASQSKGAKTSNHQKITKDNNKSKNKVQFTTIATVHEGGDLHSSSKSLVDNDNWKMHEWGNRQPETEAANVRAPSQSSVELNTFRTTSQVSFQIGSPDSEKDWGDSDGWGSVLNGKNNLSKSVGIARNVNTKSNCMSGAMNRNSGPSVKHTYNLDRNGISPDSALHRQQIKTMTLGFGNQSGKPVSNLTTTDWADDLVENVDVFTSTPGGTNKKQTKMNTGSQSTAKKISSTTRNTDWDDEQEAPSAAEEFCNTAQGSDVYQRDGTEIRFSGTHLTNGHHSDWDDYAATNAVMDDLRIIIPQGNGILNQKTNIMRTNAKSKRVLDVNGNDRDDSIHTADQFLPQTKASRVMNEHANSIMSAEWQMPSNVKSNNEGSGPDDRSINHFDNNVINGRTDKELPVNKKSFETQQITGKHQSLNVGTELTNKIAAGKISFRDQQTQNIQAKKGELHQAKNTGGSTGVNDRQFDTTNVLHQQTSMEFINQAFVENEITETIISADQNSDKKVQHNGKMIATRAWLPHSSSSSSVSSFKSGRKTPVKSLPKTQSWTAIEVDPVLGSDRLSKKFPFLSLDNNQADHGKANNKTSIKKNVSDSELLRMGKSLNILDAITGKLENFKASENEPKAPTESNTEFKKKIFYGFGIGRFRNIAATWLAKVRFKKGLVKTAQSDWH